MGYGLPHPPISSVSPSHHHIICTQNTRTDALPGSVQSTPARADRPTDEVNRTEATELEPKRSTLSSEGPACEPLLLVVRCLRITGGGVLCGYHRAVLQPFFQEARAKRDLALCLKGMIKRSLKSMRIFPLTPTSSGSGREVGYEASPVSGVRESRC